MTEDDDDELIAMYATRCNNGIVGLFCPSYGCFYNSDCYDGYCNMYSKCSKKAKPAYISDLEKQFNNALDGLANDSSTTSASASKDEATKGKNAKPTASGDTSPVGAGSAAMGPTKKTS